MTGAEAEQAIAGKRRGVHRFAMEQMHPIHGGASARQESRRQQGGVKRAELLLDRFHLHGEMAAQGGITTAHHEPAIDHASSLGFRQLWLQGPADLHRPLARFGGPQRPGVGQYEQQR